MGAKLSTHPHAVVPLFVKSKTRLKLPVIPEGNIVPAKTKSDNLHYTCSITTVFDICEAHGDCLQIESLEDDNQSEFVQATNFTSSQL